MGVRVQHTKRLVGHCRYRSGEASRLFTVPLRLDPLPRSPAVKAFPEDDTTPEGQRRARLQKAVALARLGRGDSVAAPRLLPVLLFRQCLSN